MTQRFAPRPSAQMERPHVPWGSCTLLLALIFAIPSLSAAAAGRGPPWLVSEQTGVPPRPAVVKSNANLRASPSREGNVLAVARAGTVVQIIEETSRWYRVKTEEGMEAWIRKTLAVLLQKPLRPQPEPASMPPPAHITDVQPSPTTDQPASPASPSAEVKHLPGPAISQPVPTPEQAPLVHLPRERPRDDHAFAGVQGLSVYLVAALLAGLLMAIGLQLRTARQLKRTMREVDQMKAVEEIHTDGAPAPRGLGEAPTTLVRPQTEVTRLPDLPAELSPLERAVLEIMYEHGEVQERELAAMLEKRGFPGVLIKAVIGDIVRKTGSDRPPWVGVRHTQGRYTYRLQQRDVPGHTGQRERG